MEGNKAPSGARKEKKKQVKDELDRLKQAEKKRRRLEKALATSAAIRSELEKKKNKKKEEQQRLDEEGAAIAEAVALHVLGEDSESDDMCRVMLKKDEILNPWDCASNFDLLMRGKKAGSPYHDMSKYSLEKIERVSDANRSGCMSYNWEDIDWTISSRAFGRKITMQCSNDGDWEEREISAGIIAARAVSSLRIAEDARVNTGVFTQMLRG